MKSRTKQLGPIQRLVKWVRSFRRVDGIELPDLGRSSIESIPGQFNAGGFGSVIAPFDLDILRRLKDLWLTNPDLSQHARNVKSLGNNGHTITIDAASDSIAEAALNRVNESAARLYPNGAGVDGLINQYFDQVSIFGAISSEDVVDFAAKRVSQVVLVPVEQIRFRYIDGVYLPHQRPLNLMGIESAFKNKSALGLIPLNTETYKYYALQTVQNSPYALPPAITAVNILEGPQADVFSSLAYIVNKFGIAGLVSVNVKPPTRKTPETEQEFTARAQKYLTSVRKTLEGSFNKGLLVTYNDQKIDHSNITSDARGAAEIIQFIEELGFSGMGSMPFMHGRNYTTTETFADVVFNVIIAQEEGIQRLAKRRMESTYRLDLALAGIQVDAIAMAFNQPKTRDSWRTVQAQQLEQEMALERAKFGITSPDECAQELGYEGAFDAELISGFKPAVAANSGAGLRAKRAGFSAAYRFDRESQRYRFVPQRIELAPIGADIDPGRVLPFEKKIAAAA